MATSEHVKNYNRTYYRERVRSDPERWAARQEQRRAYRQRLRTERPEEHARQLAQRRERTAEIAASDPNYHVKKRDNQRRSKYGLSVAERAELLTAQGGRCEICQREIAFGGPGHKSAAVDHCHKTGRVRGVLCGRCNLALGWFNDDPQLLRVVTAYLE